MYAHRTWFNLLLEEEEKKSESSESERGFSAYTSLLVSFHFHAWDQKSRHQPSYIILGGMEGYSRLKQ